MKRVLYFAYGSNLLLERLANRVAHLGPVKRVKAHRLMGFKLVFNASMNLSKFTPIYANIIKGTPDDYVDGVLYELDERQFKLLDEYEALYYRYFFNAGADLACVYICTRPHLMRLGKPELPYLNLLLDGCVENNLKETYAKLLEYKKKNYIIKKSRHS